MKKIYFALFIFLIFSCNSPRNVDWDKFLANGDGDEMVDIDAGDTGDTGDSGNTGNTADTSDTGNTGNTQSDDNDNDVTDDSENDEDSTPPVGTKRIFACEEKPASCASWNSVSSYEQEWNGKKWVPEDSETVFGTQSSTTACRFKCNGGCAYDPMSSTCKSIDCADDNLIYYNKERCWTEKSQQQENWYNAEGYCESINKSRLPTISELRELVINCPSTQIQGSCGVTDACYEQSCGGSACFLGCNEKFDGQYSIFSDTKGLWSSLYFSSWYNSYWFIKFSKASIEYVTYDDFYMETNFVRCINIKKGDERTFYCNSFPNGGKFNTAEFYHQTWNGSDWEPPSDKTTEYNETPSTTSCRYICDTNYTWNSDSSICEADTQIVSCTGLIENAEWNTVSEITQTWSGSSWLPTSTGTYNTTSSTTECIYKCKSGYGWDEYSETCKNSRTFYCDPKPTTGTDWNTVSSYPQTWNGTEWTPPDSEPTYNTAPSTTECRYKCSSTYHWDETYCTSNTKTFFCNAKPANSDWNTVSGYSQTWTGSTWSPSDDPTTEYNTVSSTTSCRFKCAEGYTWDGSAACK